MQVLTKQGIAQLRDLQNAIRGIAASGLAANASNFNSALGTNISMLGRWGGALETSGLALTKWGKNTQWTGRQLTTAFTLPLLLAGAAAVTFALKQERAFEQVQQAYAGGGASAQQMAHDLVLLRRTFTDLSSVYGVSLADVDAIGAAYARAGDRGYDLARATQASIETTILSGLSYQDATKFLIALRTQYGLTADQSIKAVAMIAAADQAASATFKDMSDGLARAGGAAAMFGLDVQHAVAYIAGLTPSMGSAYRSGIALQTILVRLLAPSKAGIAAYKELGINVTDMGWKHLSAAQKIDVLAQKTRGLSDAQKTIALADITSKLQVPRTIALLEAVTNRQSEYNRVLRATSNENKNSAQAQAQINTLLESSPQALKIVWTQLQNQLAQIGILILPILLNFAKGVSQVVGWFTHLSAGTQKWILLLLGGLAILGPLVRYIGAFATLAGVGFRALGTVFGWLGSEELTAEAALRAQITGMQELIVASTDSTGAIVGMAAAQADAYSVLIAQQAELANAYLVAQAANGDAAAQAVLAAKAREAAAAADIAAVQGLTDAELASLAEMQAAVAETMAALTAVPQLALGATAAFVVDAEGIVTGGTAAAVAAAAAADAAIVAEAEAALAVLAGNAAIMGAEAGAGFATGIEFGAEAGFIGLPLLVGAALVASVVLFWRFRDDIFKVFTDIVHWIGGALSQLPSIMVQVMKAVITVIAEAAKAIYQWLSYLNPFAKHSPALVDQVREGAKIIGDEYAGLHKRIHSLTGPKRSTTSHSNPLSTLNPFTKHSPSLVESVQLGIDAIMKKYQSLRGLGNIFSASNSALVAFKNNIAGIDRQLDIYALDLKKVQILKFAPGAGPFLDNLIKNIINLETQLPRVETLFHAQEAIVARWSSALGIINNRLQIQQDILTILTDRANLFKTALDQGQQALQKTVSTPIQGMRAMGDLIFKNDQAQKQLNLDMLKIADSVGVTGDVAAELAKINGQMELLKGKREALRQAGAGSDVLAGLTGQIDALHGTSDGLVAAAAKIKALQDALNRLQQTGQELNLEQSLHFDPLTREIDQVANGMKEMPFALLLANAIKQRAENDKLTASYDAAQAKVLKQAHVVDLLTLARDQLTLGYDIENQKLTEIGNAYDGITAQIQAMIQAMDDLIQKNAAAAKGPSAFAGAAGGVATTPKIPLPQGLGDWQKLLTDLEKKFKGAKLDIHLPNIKDIIENWIAHNKAIAESGVIGAAIGMMLGGPIGAGIGLAIGIGVGYLIKHFGPAIYNGITKHGAGALVGAAIGFIFGPVGALIGLIIGRWGGWIASHFGPLVLRPLATGGRVLGKALLDGIEAGWDVVTKWFGNVGSAALHDIGNLGGTLTGAGRALIGGLWRGITAIWGGIVRFFINLDKAALRYVGNLGGTLTGAGRALTGGLWRGIVATWGVVAGFFASVGGRAVAGVGNLSGRLLGAGRSILTGFWHGITAVWGGIWSFFTGLGSRLAGALGGFSTALTGAGRALLTGLWNGMKAGWNWLADHFKIKLPSIGWGPLKVGGQTIGLPHLAQGGIVGASPGGTMAVLGEAGRREAVMPLPPGLDLGRMMTMMASVERTQTRFLAQQTGTVNLSASRPGRVNHFYGNLVFPNIKNGDDAEKLIRNLESMDA